MLSPNKNNKLKQLFQLKKNIENPDQCFWEHFDKQLQQKICEQKTLKEEIFVEQRAKISPWFVLCNLIQKSKNCVRFFTYAICCVVFVMFLNCFRFRQMESSYRSERNENVISFQKSWADVTLTFNAPKKEYTNYICNDIHISRLNSSPKELAF